MGSTKISCITVSNRPERLEIVKKALETQSEPHEHIIEDYEDKSKLWSFNKATNMALKKAKGDLIVFIQDSIHFNPDALTKFWFHYQQNPKACVSGVGDQYETLGGKRVWVDPRKQLEGSFIRVRPEEIEFNFCAIPKQALFEVGGFDEVLDETGYGMDNISVMERIDDMGGYEYFLDKTNESFSVYHGRRKDWDLRHNMHGAYQERKKYLIESGIWPKLNYLDQR